MDIQTLKETANVNYITVMNNTNTHYEVDCWLEFDWDENSLFFTQLFENHGQFATEAEAETWIKNHEIDWEDAFVKFNENYWWK